MDRRSFITTTGAIGLTSFAAGAGNPTTRPIAADIVPRVTFGSAPGPDR
jgi:hypothetical protein